MNLIEMSSARHHTGDRAGPARREDVFFCAIDEEAVAYDVAHDVVHYLNRTARFIWERCDGRRSIEDLTEEVAAAFEPNQDGGCHSARCLTDVRNTLRDFADNGLLEQGGR